MSSLAGGIVDWKEARKAFLLSFAAQLVSGYLLLPIAVVLVNIIPALQGNNKAPTFSDWFSVNDFCINQLPQAVTFGIAFMFPLCSRARWARWASATLVLLLPEVGALLRFGESSVAQLSWFVPEALIFGGVVYGLCKIWDRSPYGQVPEGGEEVRVSLDVPVLGVAFVFGAFASLLQSVTQLLLWVALSGGRYWSVYWTMFSIPAELLGIAIMGATWAWIFPARNKRVYQWVLGAYALQVLIKASVIAYHQWISFPYVDRPFGRQLLSSFTADFAVTIVSVWAAIMLYLLVSPEEKIGEWSERRRIRRHEAKVKKAREWLRED